MASGRAVEATRAEVSIARFDGECRLPSSIEESTDAIPAGLAPRDFAAEHTAPILSLVLPHSLYQRPPPLQN